jgi:hypothetical protein
LRSRKIADQGSPEAAILVRQAGYGFELPNFVSKRLSSLVEGCALDGLLSHETQEANIVVPAARGIGSMKEDGNGCPPISSCSTRLLKVVFDRRRMLPMNNHSHV